MFAYLAIAFGFGTGWIVRSLMIRAEQLESGPVRPLLVPVEDFRQN